MFLMLYLYFDAKKVYLNKSNIKHTNMEKEF
jgi:hypothetical protein